MKNLVVEVDAKYIKGMINNPDIQPSAAVNRWIAAILLFDFQLRHVPGKEHGLDGLSRRPRAPEDPDIDDDYDEWIDVANALALLQHTTSLHQDKTPWIHACNTFGIEILNPVQIFSARQAKPIASRSITIPRSAKAKIRDAELMQIRTFLLNPQRPPNLTDDAFK